MGHTSFNVVFPILLVWFISTVLATSPVKDIKCPVNEVLVSCKRTCPPDTCDTLWLSYLCVADEKCTPGCTCAENYLRTNSTGICVPQDRCLPKECADDPNAVSGCGNRCGKTCADYKNVNKVCSDVCQLNGCDCRDGYVYDENIKRCVKPCDCTPQCTGPNEKYVDCLIGQCVPKKCDDIGKPIACPSIVPPCPGGCICKEKYLRNSKGICIKESECPQVCGKNEEFKCGPSCPEASCDNRNPPICINKKCKLGCFCKKGFVRNAKNRCVPVNKCPVQCGPNAHYNETANPFPATCAYTFPRLSSKPFEPGCECDDGYLLNINNKCVKIEDCPDQAGCSVNQTWASCVVRCPDGDCPYDDNPVPVCDAPNPCPGGCRCNLNYRYNSTGHCILSYECPPVNCTRPNEVWDACPSACLAENCEDVNNQPTVCNTLVLNCQPRCVCKKNHFRNKEGICIPAQECSGVCKDQNAQWRNCPDGPDPCPATCQYTLPVPCDKACVSGCQCNTGYVLSEPDGICVKIEECPEYANCRNNETWVPCNHHCPNTVCPTSDSILACRPPNPCPGGCGCQPGYRRNLDNNCIKASECPPVECTRPNERWESCSSEDYIEDCSLRKETGIANIKRTSDICYPGCICKDNYCRNEIRECVPENSCKE